MVLCVQALAAASIGESVTHVVKPGDTLSGISRQYYGDARRWNRILEANSLVDPDRLREGQRLVIPGGEAPASVLAPSPAAPADGGTRPDVPVSTDTAASPVRPHCPSVVALESDSIRRLAAAAVVQQYTNLDLSAYDPGYLVRLESPTPEVGERVVVSWLGREALAMEKGATPDLDRKQVLKIEVWLTEDGRVLKITDRPVWLSRRLASAPAP